jgi:hypothetical protein
MHRLARLAVRSIRESVITGFPDDGEFYLITTVFSTGKKTGCQKDFVEKVH